MTGLADARSLLESAPAGTVSAWPRAAAILARLELEEALAGYWLANRLGLQFATMRDQLNCLHVYRPDVAADVAFTWHGLTRATHHRPYELDPTKAELVWLIDSTERAVAALA